MIFRVYTLLTHNLSTSTKFCFISTMLLNCTVCQKSASREVTHVIYNVRNRIHVGGSMHMVMY